MANLTVVARQIRAKDLAKQAGQKWTELSKDQRKTYMASSVKSVQPEDRRRALRALAKKEATAAGKNWAELTKDQRKPFIASVRAKVRTGKKQKPKAK